VLSVSSLRSTAAKRESPPACMPPYYFSVFGPLTHRASQTVIANNGAANYKRALLELLEMVFCLPAALVGRHYVATALFRQFNLYQEMCITLRKDCKLTTMDSEAPLADNPESACLISHLPQEPQLLRPVYIPKGDDGIVTIIPHGERRWCPSAVTPADAPDSKRKG